MTIRRFHTAIGVILLAALLAPRTALSQDTSRIVSTDGITTETIFALGAGDRVVARDEGSVYPETAAELPNIGMGHQINPEAILSMKPTLIIGRDRPMSKPAFQVLESAGMEVMRLSAEPGLDTARENIRRLAQVLNKESEGKELIVRLDADLEKLRDKQAQQEHESAPKALVVYLRPNATLVMGEDSNAARLAHLAGARSALPGVTGHKPLNAEAVIAARPDVILCYKKGLASVGGLETLYAQPGIAETPAARNKRVIAMDDLLLGGFGPRSGQALLELHHALFDVEGPYVAGDGGADS